VNIKKTGGIPKDGFHPFQFFGNGFREVDKKIQECRSADPNDKDDLALKLADMLDTLNALHPFREGNGRTQRLTIEFLALEKGYALNLSPDNEKGYRGYMDGTTNADKNLLAETISEQMAKIPQKTKKQKPPPKGDGAALAPGP
jgi:cell filamentation protein